MNFTKIGNIKIVCWANEYINEYDYRVKIK